VTDSPNTSGPTGPLPSLDRDKSKSDLLDKFREREERARSEEGQKSEDKAADE
jgi:hypothetical protein